MKKQKQVIRTKDQILSDLKTDKKFAEKMSFMRDKMYPALIKATISIDDATQNLSIINTVIMEKFLGLMKEKTMKDIDLVSNLSKEDDQYENLSAFISLFDDMSVFDAKDLLEGMKNEITLFVTEENKNRSLAELKTKWIDQM